MSKSNIIKDQGKATAAIAAIQSCIRAMSEATQEYKLSEKVIEKIRSGEVVVAQYPAEEGSSYLGGQYTYVSQKTGVGEVTYFVGVKNDQLCIGTVDGDVVTELDEEGRTNAMKGFDRRFEPIKSTVNALGRVASNVVAALTPSKDGKITGVANDGNLVELRGKLPSELGKQAEVDMLSPGENSFDQSGMDSLQSDGDILSLLSVGERRSEINDREGYEEEGQGDTFNYSDLGSGNRTLNGTSSLSRDTQFKGRRNVEFEHLDSGSEDEQRIGIHNPRSQTTLQLRTADNRVRSAVYMKSSLLVDEQRGSPTLRMDLDPLNSSYLRDDLGGRSDEDDNFSVNEQNDQEEREKRSYVAPSKREPSKIKAIAAIQSCIIGMGQDTQEYKLSEKVIEKIRYGEVAVAKYTAEEGPSYLGGQYTYHSKKTGGDEVTYFVGVKNDQFCIGTVDEDVVTELDGEGRTNAMERLDKEFEPINSRVNAVGIVVSNSVPAPLRSAPSNLSAEALLQRRIQSLLEGIDERLDGNDTVAIGNITFTRTRTGDAVQFKIDNSAYLMKKGGVYLESKSGVGIIETALAGKVCDKIEAQLFGRVVEEENFSMDDRGPKRTSKKTETSRNVRFKDRGEEEKEDYQPPYQRSVSGIITANPGNNDTGFGVFTTSQNSEIQKLVKAMESESSATGLPKATSDAFRIIVEHFARRKEKAGLPKGINCIEHGNVAQGLYTAFHFYANGRDVVVGFKSALQQDDSAMERSLEPFFGTAELNTGIITAIHEEEGGKFLPALQSQLNSPFNRIAEVDNLTLKAVVSDLMGGVTNQDHLDLGGGLKLVPVVHIDANNAKVAAVTGSGAEYSIVVTKGEAQVEEPKMVTLSGRSTKAASSKVARDVEDRCGKLLKQKRTFEWMSEVALGYHHPDLAISIGATTTDEEIEDAARTQAVYDTFKESLKTMGDKTAIDKALEVSVSESKGGFDYVQNGVKKHFGIDESGRLVFLKEQSGQQVSVQPKDLKDADIDALVTLMGFDKGLFRATLADKRDDLFHQRDNLLLKERPEGLSPLSNRWDGHPSSSSRGAFPNRHENHFDERVDILRSRPRVSSLRETTGGSLTNPLYNQRGIHPSSSVSKPEAYRFGGEQVQVYSYQNNAERTVLQRGSQLIKAIVEKPKEAEVVRDSIVANAIIVAAAKNGLTPAQAIAIIKFSIDQRGFSNMRGDRTRINLANEFAENSVGLSPEGPRDDPGFRAMAKFSADFQKETTKAGLKRWDSEFEEGKRDGLNSSDIPISAINMMRRRIDAGTLDPDKIFTSEDVSGSKSEIENAAVKSNQSRSSGR